MFFRVLKLLPLILISLLTFFNNNPPLDNENLIFAQTMGEIKLTPSESKKDPSAFTIARLKYAGGGDWYWGSSAIPNMLKFLKDNTNIPVNEEEVRVSIMDKELFNYPFLFLTGHGNIKFSD
ncbi:MAG: DUF4159 domain-containing protein, partial [candidate division Zixibacteria bacterium]|nr:DUF4159 domain-containing protein [candidate division Zixibacteria bacterium]